MEVGGRLVALKVPAVGVGGDYGVNSPSERDFEDGERRVAECFEVLVAGEVVAVGEVLA